MADAWHGEMTTFRWAGPARRWRRAGVITAIAAAASFAAFPVPTYDVAGSNWLSLLPFFGTVVFGLLTAGFQATGWIAGVRRVLGAASASVREDALRVICERERIEVPLADLRSAIATREGIVIEDRGGREIRSPMRRPAANRLLDDLGVGPGRRRHVWRFRVRGWAGWKLGAACGVVVSIVMSLLSLSAWSCVLFVLSGALGGAIGAAAERRWRFARVAVGFDGVHVARGSSEEWMRFEDVTWIGATDGLLTLALADGRQWAPPWKTVDPGLIEEIQIRLVRAHALAIEHGNAPEPPETRGDVGDGAYRTRAKPADDDLDATRDVLECPLSPDEARVEAASSLVAAGQASDRELVRLVAEACGHPKVRATLRDIAGSE